ncbi:hypothetical protein CDAR_248631 [Caerostris darwini]|uniref:Uncharacterized protein n=1 Tax=Caerostris darwini TaxID=1538125 RepID=A0AAV4MRE1_9ARAC|nr:hypothetical protein CDAR_248631 [Caerostris darwini]
MTKEKEGGWGKKKEVPRKLQRKQHHHEIPKLSRLECRSHQLQSKYKPPTLYRTTNGYTYAMRTKNEKIARTTTINYNDGKDGEFHLSPERGGHEFLRYGKQGAIKKPGGEMRLFFT